MTYRSLLLMLDPSPLCRGRTDLAIGMARKMDCHLVGLAPTGLIELPATLNASASLAELNAMGWDAMRQRARHSADTFAQACRDAGLGSFEAVVDEFDMAGSLVRHAHCSDLCVLSQADPQEPAYHWNQAVLERVIMDCARPTLVVPYAGRFAQVGSRALVAWDNSRESTRAVSDALPLLRRATQVDVVIWNEDEASESTTRRQDLTALQKWLMWQGVAADVQVESTAIDIADAMLSRASDAGADLIVMGAYGHARLAERVLGGATRGLLNSMTVPVLMSH